MDTQEINNGESGSSVRSKLNNLFRNIILGSEGLNKLWESLRNLSLRVTQNKESADNSIQSLSQEVQSSQQSITTQMSNLSSNVSQMVDEYKNGVFKNRGYYLNSTALTEAHPTDSKGAIAYVGANYPFQIWVYDGTQWVDSGETGGGEISLTEYVRFMVEAGVIVYLKDNEGNTLFPITKDTAIEFTENGDILRKSLNLSDVADRQAALDNILDSAEKNNQILVVINGTAQWGTYKPDWNAKETDFNGILHRTHYIGEGTPEPILTRTGIQVMVGDRYVELGNYDVPDAQYSQHPTFTITINNVDYHYVRTETSPGGSVAVYENQSEEIVELIASQGVLNRLRFAEATSAYTMDVVITRPTAVYVPLDERFIPPQIPRFSDLPRPDWNENAESSRNHILHRTHFENPPVTIMDRTFPASSVSSIKPLNLEHPLIAGKKYLLTIQGLGSLYDGTKEVIAEEFPGYPEVIRVKDSNDIGIYYSENFPAGFDVPEGYNAYYWGLGMTYGEHIKVVQVGTIEKLNNKYLNLDQTYNALSENAQSGKAVAQALGTIEGLIPVGTSIDNQLVNEQQLNDKMADQLAEFISADSSMVTSFEHCTTIGNSQNNLEQGPWFKDHLQCGSTNDIYVTKNDYAIVLQDESVCYFEAYGYRYQRRKDGGASDFGYVVLPDGSEVLIRQIDDVTSPYHEDLYFIDTSKVFSQNNLCFVVTDLNVLTESVFEMENGYSGTILNKYDLHYPTTRYVCSASQTANTPPTWSFNYIVNDEALTGSQIRALNSGITEQLVAKIMANETAIQGKQDALVYSTNIIEDAQGRINLNTSISVQEINGIEGDLSLIADYGPNGVQGKVDILSKSGRTMGGRINVTAEAEGTINIEVQGRSNAGNINIENGKSAGSGGAINIKSKGVMLLESDTTMTMKTTNNSFEIVDSENRARYSEILTFFTDPLLNYSRIEAIQSSQSSAPPYLRLCATPNANASEGGHVEVTANAQAGDGGHIDIVSHGAQNAAGGQINLNANGGAGAGRIELVAAGGAGSTSGHIHIQASQGATGDTSEIVLSAKSLKHGLKEIDTKTLFQSVAANETIQPNDVYEVTGNTYLSTLPTLGVGSANSIYNHWDMKIRIANNTTLWSSVSIEDVVTPISIEWIGDCTAGATTSDGLYLVSIGQEGVGVIIKIA